MVDTGIPWSDQVRYPAIDEVRDFTKARGPEYYQHVLVIFRTSADEVRNLTKTTW